MISKEIKEGENSAERKQVSADFLKTVRNNICENTLQLEAKGMERKLHNRLHTLSSQASQLRQDIKVLNMEKQKADLEIKKRYFPGHDFRQDETQLQTSMRRLILQCNQFYLNKKQRYPIRACIKSDKINSACILTSSSNSSEKQVPVESVRNKRSKSECSNRQLRKKNINSGVVSKIKEERGLESGSDRSRTLPEILLLPAEKEEKPTQPTNMKHVQKLARFSVLLGTGKNGLEDTPAKFPTIQNDERDNGRSPVQGSRLEDPDEKFDSSLLREILSGTNVKTFTNLKPKIVPGYCSSQQSSRRGDRFDRSHFQNLLELESTRVKWKIDNYFRQDKKNPQKEKSRETPELEYSQEDNSSPSLSEESFRLYREREAMNTVPRDVTQIRQDHNWRLTPPVQRSEDFIDNLTVITMAGMQGLNCHDISFIPLNSARRALRHTPTFKMQQFLKQMMAHRTQAQQFEVSKLQAELQEEFEATVAAEMESKPSDQPPDQADPAALVQVLRDISEGLEPEVTERSDQNVKTTETLQLTSIKGITAK